MNTLTPSRPSAETLWLAGEPLTAAELSSLLEESTGWSVEVANLGDDGVAFFLIDPYGDRDGDGWDCLDDLAADVAFRIDEALADA